MKLVLLLTCTSSLEKNNAEKTHCNKQVSLLEHRYNKPFQEKNKTIGNPILK